MSTATDTALSSPYKGLAAYEDTELDALLFFGRARETEVVAANVLASRLTVLYGPSGVGKSSLLRAGVVQALRSWGATSPPAVAVYGSWSGDPLAGLEEAAKTAVGEALGREATDAPGTLTDRLAAWSAELGAELCLMLDQLEELFLYHPAADGAGGFVDLLPELVTRPGLHVNVLLGLRDDTLAQLDVFKRRIPALFANSLRLDHLDHEAARAAIVGPLGSYNELAGEAIEIEPALVAAVLDEVEAGRIEPRAPDRGEPASARPSTGLIETPYLQLVMQRVWEVERDRGSRVLRLETFRGLGGAQQIVEDHLERALRALTTPERDAAATVFGHLVTPSGTKVAHGIADLASYASMSESQLEPVLRSLAQERILRPLGKNGHGAGSRYEIFHDVLGEAVLSWRIEHETARQLERERREAERKHRRVLAVAAVALFALAAMTAVAIFALAQRGFALDQRENANRRAQQAHARELIAQAASQLDVDPLESLRLGMAASRVERTDQVEDILRQALLRSRLRQVLPVKGAVRAAIFNRDGDRVAVAGDGDSVHIFEPQTGRQLRVIRDQSQIDGTAFSPDGRLLATANRGGGVRVWRVETGALQAVNRFHTRLTNVRFSPDGRLLLAWGGGDWAAHVWSLLGRPTNSTLRNPRRVTSAVFTPDSTQVLTLAGDRFARIFSVDGRLLQSLEHPARVTSASFSPLGRVLVTGSADRLGRIWYPARAEQWKTLRGHTAPILDVAFSPNGSLVATGSADGMARVWSAATGNVVATMDLHANIVREVAFSPQAGRSLVTVSSDGATRVWQTRSSRQLATLAGPGSLITSATFSRNGRTVLTGGEDGVARIWDAQAEPGLRVLSRHKGGVTSAALSPTGAFVVSGGPDGFVRVTRLRSSVRRTIPIRSPVVRVAASPDSFAASSRRGRVYLWRADRLTPPRILPLSARADALAFSSDGKMLATGSRDGVVRLWDVRTAREIDTLRGLGSGVRAVAFSPKGSLVLAGSDRGETRVWTTRGELRSVLRGHRAGITSAAFAPDGKSVVTTSGYAWARLWNAQTGRILHTLRGHKDGINASSFSSDGRLVATASLDHDVRIWNVATGELVRTLNAHFASVSDVGFSTDGRWLVTGGPLTAGVWATANGRRLFNLRGHGAVVRTAAFVPHGTRIVTSSADGSVRTYVCRLCGDLDDLRALAERRLARLDR
jgi:WD40 repeat protein